MRTAMSMVSLLFLLLLMVEASQGIRFDVESSSLLQKIIHKGSLKGAGDAAEVACKDGELCSGKERKLMTKPVATTKTETSKEKNIGHQSMEEINKEKQKDSVVESPQAYTDLLDISGMDYSPARRKSPIHN